MISRSSVIAYRDGEARDLRVIGEQLGVANVLEGSVRRAGNRVLVNVALIDCRNDRRIWAERYDRTLADSLTLQGELAQEIGAALSATLTPAEKARVETKPTHNAEGYETYLRGLAQEGISKVGAGQNARGVRGISLDPPAAKLLSRPPPHACPPAHLTTLPTGQSEAGDRCGALIHRSWLPALGCKVTSAWGADVNDSTATDKFCAFSI